MIYHDISFHIMTICYENKKTSFLSQKRPITTFSSLKVMITHLLIAFEDLLGSSIALQVVPHWSLDISFERDKKKFSWKYMTNIDEYSWETKRYINPPHTFSPSMWSIHCIDREDHCQRRWALFKQLCPSFSSPSVRFFPLLNIDVQQFDMKHFEHLKPFFFIYFI